MKRNHTGKTFAVGIIVLFIGVGIHPVFAVDTKSTISNNQIKECKECNEISDTDLVKAGRLLDKVEVYSKLLLVLSKHQPEVLEDYEEISNKISTLKGLFEELTDDDNPIICNILEAINDYLYSIGMYFYSFTNSPSAIIGLIAYFLSKRISGLMDVNMAFAIYFYCDWVYPPLQ